MKLVAGTTLFFLERSYSTFFFPPSSCLFIRRFVPICYGPKDSHDMRTTQQHLCKRDGKWQLPGTAPTYLAACDPKYLATRLNFCFTRTFTAVFTAGPYSAMFKSILILSSDLRQWPVSGLFPINFEDEVTFLLHAQRQFVAFYCTTSIICIITQIMEAVSTSETSG
jgi:hypothetical protein